MNEKSRFTVILGATNEGKLYPPVVIISGGKYPGIEWNPSFKEFEKDEDAYAKLKKSRELGYI